MKNLINTFQTRYSDLAKDVNSTLESMLKDKDWLEITPKENTVNDTVWVYLETNTNNTRNCIARGVRCENGRFEDAVVFVVDSGDGKISTTPWIALSITERLESLTQIVNNKNNEKNQ